MPSLQSTALLTLFSALSHFDGGARGEVVYREQPFKGQDHESYWVRSGWYHIGAVERGNAFPEGVSGVPVLFDLLSDDECREVIAFVDKHRKSYWALDAIRSAVIDQGLSGTPVSRSLVHTVAALWDSTNAHVGENDCYSYRIIKGLRVGEASAPEDSSLAAYCALARFAVVVYQQRGRCGVHDGTHPVREDNSANWITVQEPYRAVIMENPAQIETILRWEELVQGSMTQMDELYILLRQDQSNALIQGML